MKAVLSLVGFVILLSACKEVELKDAVVPDEYRNEAKLLEKRFDGEIFRFIDFRNGRRQADQIQRGALKFWLTPENQFKIVTNLDFAGKNCGSKLGAITKLAIDSRERIVGLEVSLDRGHCEAKVEGKVVRFEIGDEKTCLRIKVAHQQNPELIETSGMLCD